jgi:hypothetical protein
VAGSAADLLPPNSTSRPNARSKVSAPYARDRGLVAGASRVQLVPVQAQVAFSSASARPGPD